ncbi:autophagy-related protein 27 [Aspergillus karnatakaensis]|uniref:autophagy-related protein 27 n=1 Tax=Aspergillus karnatakaensis TaxID=1810916 RepID=UPI003CCC9369
MRIPSSSLLSAAVLLPTLASAVSFDCAQIKIDDTRYDLSALAGPYEFFHAEKHDETTVNTTYVLNVCNTLKGAATRGRLHCGTSKNICGFQYTYDGDARETSFAFPIVGLDPMGHGAKDPEIIRLKEIDEEREGLRVKLSGGEYPVEDGKSKDTGALIDFECDPDKSGLEGLSDAVKRLLRSREDSKDDSGDEKEGEGKGDGDKEPFNDGSNPDRSLQFKSFEKGDDKYVLNLTWKTRYACDDYLKNREPSSGHWGFFTWLIIIFFLCAAAYLIFGSWLNYNRYGARGWDLLPHGDTLRDVPYLFQDWLRRVVNTFQGTGSRGGYSAV